MKIILDGVLAHSPVTVFFIRRRTEKLAHTGLRENEHMKVEAEIELSGYKLRGLQKLKEARMDPIGESQTSQPC